VADKTYLRDSILSPWRQIVQGYGAEMPSYAGNLTEPDVIALSAYIEAGLPAAETTRQPLPSADDNPVDVINRYASPIVGQEKSGGTRR
jgi:hypothetical protein